MIRPALQGRLDIPSGITDKVNRRFTSNLGDAAVCFQAHFTTPGFEDVAPQYLS